MKSRKGRSEKFVMPGDPSVSASAFKDPSFRWLWFASVSAHSASAVGTVVIPLLAIQVLGLTSGTIALLATAAACVALVVGLPTGMFAEFRKKRPILIGADCVRFGVFAALGVLQFAGQLSPSVLLLAMCSNAAMQVLFGSASLAHTKDLVPSSARADAVGKLQGAAWAAMICGPIAAGTLVAVIPIGVVVVSIALCFLGSAVCIVCIRKPEGLVPKQTAGEGKIRELFAGVRFFAFHAMLRRLLVSWVLFAGAVAALTPVTQVFFLRDLAFSPEQYGLAMGIPSLAALLGAWMSGRVIGRLGVRRTILFGSLLRVPMYFIYPFLPPGTAGLIGAVAAFGAILFLSSLVNAGLSTLRMELIPDSLMSRTSSAWMMFTMLAGPILIPVAGVVMASSSPRVALWVIAGIVTLSAAVLPMSALNRRYEEPKAQDV
ncbi:MFS transporter [Nesterenkonia muleiensis]|uniref:MFS transporter n=1 Tax=Nesterenkonia muleiensis TaxID=2282648 RepID=UPI000E71DA4D|nr:MFS transporter [Nesterenkonia muleiensis]